MNYKMMGRFNALILTLEAAFMLPALIICLADGDGSGIKGFLVAIGATALTALILYILSRGAKRDFYAKEGLVCVGMSWVIMSIFGCLPFCISGQIPKFTDALFEIVSGFTTTGASIVPDVEALSRGILYWRSFSNWIGGMGVLVFLLAIIPVGGKNEGFTMHILRAESPGPDVGKLVPKMRQTAMILYLTYIALTFADFLFLLAGKMSVFDAVCTAISTAGTGGFGIKNASIAAFSPYIQNVCAVFMILFGINFSCYYLLMLRNFKAVFKDEELRTFIGVVVASIALISVNIYHIYQNIGETLRYAFFQVASIVSTTGFATADFDAWPIFSRSILLMLMFIGGCAGSTAGGFKFARLLLIFKTIKRNISQILNPQKVKVVRMNGKPVDEKIVANTNAYLSVYIIILIVSGVLISIDGFSVTTNISAVISCFNNIGPGLDAVGPTCNYAAYGVFSKIILIINMLAGRLEIFPILVLFNPRAWKRS